MMRNGLLQDTVLGLLHTQKRPTICHLHSSGVHCSSSCPFFWALTHRYEIGNVKTNATVSLTDQMIIFQGFCSLYCNGQLIAAGCESRNILLASGNSLFQKPFQIVCFNKVILYNVLAPNHKYIGHFQFYVFMF